MKSLFTFLSVLFLTAGFSQTEKPTLNKADIKPLAEREFTLKHGSPVVQDLQVKECWVEPEWPENELLQPTVVNELPNGTMPLSKDLPFVHTIRGTVYTYEHLKYQVR